MLHVGVNLDVGTVIDVLAATRLELAREKEKLETTIATDDLEQLIVRSSFPPSFRLIGFCLQESIESKVTTVLYLVVIITHLIKNVKNEPDIYTIKRLIYDINQLNVSWQFKSNCF